MTKPKVSPLQSRAAVLEIKPGEGEAPATIRAALSSETPVRRVFGLEVLRHTSDSIDLSRASNGLPLTVNHSEQDPTSPALPVGRVRGITLDADGKLRGDLVFDSDEQGQAVRGKVERGIAPDVSITYGIDSYDPPDDDGRVVITRWQPRAVSIVSVPADAAAGAGRSDNPEATMPEERTPEAGGASIVDTVRDRTQAGFAEGERAAVERLNAIQDTVDQLSRSQPHLSAQLAELGRVARQDVTMTVDRFRAEALNLFGSGIAPANPADPESAPSAPTTLPAAPGMARQPLVQPGADSLEKMGRGMVDAIFQRAGGRISDEEMAGNQFRGWSLFDIASECLAARGIAVRGMSREQVARAALAMGSRAISPGTANYVTSDFPAVTENVITKLVHQGYGEAEVTWNQWCSSREVPDFKTFTVPRLSAMPDLPTVAENAAYTDLTQVDAKESSVLVKHGGLFSLSWEAVVNDDQAMFGETSVKMGDSAARTVDRKVYAALTESPGAGPVQGPVMGDGNQLFDGANHANVGSAALDLAGIVSTRVAMARQTDDNSQEVGIILRYIIVPEELFDAANNLAGSEYLPWPESAPGAQRVNTVRNTFQVVSTIRLTDANDWFAAGRQETMEVAFLSGNRQPAVMREEGWNTDALHWKIRHPSVAYPRDWRALYFNSVT